MSQTMKVLSDKTAKRLLRLLDESGRGARQGRGAAAFTPPALLWQLHVRAGTVSIDRGFWLEGGEWRESLAQEIGEASVGYVVAEPDGGDLSLSICAADAMPEGDFRVIGEISGDAESGWTVRQYESGPLVFDSAAHWGETEPLVGIPGDSAGEWNANMDPEEATAAAKSYLVDIDVDEDGKVTAKHYRTDTIDTKGNVVAVSERTRSAVPSPGDADEDDDEPPCGNPLNESDDTNPLDLAVGGGGGGDGDSGNDEDYDDENPLDREGDGGYTPKCRKE